MSANTIILGILVVALGARLTGATFWGIPTSGPRTAHCMVSYGPDSAVFFGGMGLLVNSYANDVHLYNVQTNRWLSIETFGVPPTPRIDPVCFVYNHSLYVFGGDDSFGLQYTPVDVLTDMHSLDLTSFTWKTEPSAPIGSMAAGTLVNNKLVVYGGQYPGQAMSYYAETPCTNTTMLYDPVTRQWTVLVHTGGDPGPRCNAGMATLGGTKAYMTGGSIYAPWVADINAVHVMDVWEFDTVTQLWTNLQARGSFPTRRVWHVMVGDPVTQKLYVAGGSTSVSTSLDIGVFDASPSNRSWSSLTTLSTAIINGKGFLVHNTLYMSAGFSGGFVTSGLLSLNLATKQFLPLATMDDTLSAARQRVQYASAAFNNTWYVHGGAQVTVATVHGDLMALDLATYRWYSVPQYGTPPPAIFGHTLVTMGHRGILFGGCTANYVINYNDVYALDFATATWTLVNTTGTQPAVRCYHSAIVWNQKMVIFAGDNCCFGFNDVWFLDFAPVTPTWSKLITSASVGSPPPPYFFTTASVILYGHTMMVFGGGNAFHDLWAVDLVSGQWTLRTPAPPALGPPGRAFAAHVLVGDHWYINGGQDAQNHILGDTWVLTLSTNTWTQIKTLDVNSPTPEPTSMHQGVVSPFGDQLIIWGPGAPSYHTQFLSPGYHDIVIDQTKGSDVNCQVDETQPCQTFAFAMSRFAGASYLEFTVSADLRNTFTISSSQIVHNMHISVPVLLQASVPNIVLDCQHATCFTITNVRSNPFTLVNLVIQNGYGIQGGAVSATNSLIDLKSVTIRNSLAQQSGGAIYLDGSTLSMSNVVLKDNTALLTGGAIYAYRQSSVSSQNSWFTDNLAHSVGGALYAVNTDLDLANTNFTSNHVIGAANSSTFMGGGAIAAIDSVLSIRGSSLDDNSVQAVPAPSALLASTYGGALFLYATDMSMQSVDMTGNTAMYGGAIASMSVPVFAATMLSTVVQASNLLLAQSTLASNVASADGGALYVTDAQTLSVLGCSWSGNMAVAMGGAMFVSSTTTATVQASTLSDNVCSKGNGGAAAWFGTPVQVTNTRLVGNTAPMGGGGAFYWGSKSDSSSTSTTSAAAPVMDVVTLSSASRNRAAFGNQLASDPASLITSPFNARLLQNASRVLSPAIIVNVLDFHQQVVVVNGTTIKAIVHPDSALASSGRVASTVNGQALFDALIVTAPPGTSFNLTFVMAGSGTGARALFQTATLQITTDICHKGSRHNVDLQRCEACPPRTTTLVAMYNGTCLALNQPGDILTWNVNVAFVVIGLAVFGGSLCWVEFYIHRFLACVLGSRQMIGWIWPYLWLCFNWSLTDWAQVSWMVHVIGVSTTNPNDSETLTTGLPWLWTFVAQFLVVGLWHAVAIYIYRQALVYHKQGRKQTRQDDVTFVGSQASRPGKPSSGTGSGSGTASIEFKKAGANGEDGGTDGGIMTEEERMVKRNQRRIERMGWVPLSLIGLSAIFHFAGSTINIWMCLHGAMQTSQWRVASMSNTSTILFGYWLIPGSLCMAVLLFFRMDPRTGTWYRHLCSLALSWLWWMIHWTSWLTQPLVYQDMPTAAHDDWFWSGGSSPLLVFFVVACPLGILFVLHIMDSRRDANNGAFHERQMRLLDRRNAVRTVGLLYHAGHAATLSLKLYNAMHCSSNKDTEKISVHSAWLRFLVERYGHNPFPIQDLNQPSEEGGSKTRYDDLVKFLKDKRPSLDIFAQPLTTNGKEWLNPIEMATQTTMTFGAGSAPVKSQDTYAWGTVASITTLMDSVAAQPPFILFSDSKCHDSEMFLTANAIHQYKAEMAVVTTSSLSVEQKQILAQSLYDHYLGNGDTCGNGSAANISEGKRQATLRQIQQGLDLDKVFDPAYNELVGLQAQNLNQSSRLQDQKKAGFVPVMTYVMKVINPKAFETEADAPAIEPSTKLLKPPNLHRPITVRVQSSSPGSPSYPGSLTSASTKTSHVAGESRHHRRQDTRQDKSPILELTTSSDLPGTL